MHPLRDNEQEDLKRKLDEVIKRSQAQKKILKKILVQLNRDPRAGKEAGAGSTQETDI